MIGFLDRTGYRVRSPKRFDVKKYVWSPVADFGHIMPMADECRQPPSLTEKPIRGGYAAFPGIGFGK